LSKGENIIRVIDLEVRQIERESNLFDLEVVHIERGSNL
jgi:hypothetical protein